MGLRATVPALIRLGLVSPTVDRAAFADVVAAFAGMDWDIYLDTLHRLESHDAWDVLPTVDVPTLMIAGERDLLTPAATALRIHQAVPGSRLVSIAGGTHYTPVEYPGAIADAVLDLLARVPGWAVARPASLASADVA
jgi:pimeloyl-ACP methyl ester carboxylesterase